MKKVYAYYESLALTNQAEEFSKANLWKESWTRAGWNPVMLNTSHAQISNVRNKLFTKLFQSFPSLIKEQNECEDTLRLRLNRLCALHAAGGGWMSDYDVLNIGFSPQLAEAYEKNSFVISGKPAYLIWISNEIINAAMSKILSTDLIVEGKMLYEQEIFNPFLNLESQFTPHLQDYENMKKIFLEKN